VVEIDSNANTALSQLSLRLAGFGCMQEVAIVRATEAGLRHAQENSTGQKKWTQETQRGIWTSVHDRGEN
jgi:hypothetical protein